MTENHSPADTAGTAVSETPPSVEPKPSGRQVNGWFERLRERKAATPAPPAPRGVWTVIAVIALALLVGLIVVVGLRTSLGALRDAALAAHIETQAASLYWIGVDGLIVVAIIAALILRHDPAARRYCLAVIGLFTIASGLLQYLHGLGWFTPDPVTKILKPLPWGVVLVIAILVIGTIFCGTHLFVHTLRRLFPGVAAHQPKDESAPFGTTATATVTQTTAGDASVTETAENHPAQGVTRTPEQDREERKAWAAITVRLLMDNNIAPPRKRLAAEYGISPRQVGYVVADVTQEREEQAERDAQEAKANSDEPAPGEWLTRLAETPALNGSHPVAPSTGDPS